MPTSTSTPEQPAPVVRHRPRWVDALLIAAVVGITELALRVNVPLGEFASAISGLPAALVGAAWVTLVVGSMAAWTLYRRQAAVRERRPEDAATRYEPGSPHQALREVSALRAALDEHSILSVTDRTGCILDVNAGFCRISGYARAELIGQDHRLLNSGTHATDFWHGVWRQIAAGQPWRGEVCNRRRDGSLYWVDSTIVPWMDEDGRVQTYVSIRFDVTQQKQAEAKLQHATALLEEAQSIARLGSWSYDLSSGRITWTKENFRLVGRDEAEQAPDYASMLTDFVPADVVRLEAAMHEAVTEGTAYSLVLRTRAGANGVRWVRGEGRARRGPAGHVVGLYGTIMDVTDAIEREEALRREQDRAESASRSKSEFLANMSHEIRTPLTAILGYADVLRDEALRTEAPAESVLVTETIRRAGEHLLALINDILDLSKIEAGRLAVERLDTDLSCVLFDVNNLMRARAAAKGVAVDLVLETPVPQHILTDPTRLRQILVNLIGNAVKFTEHGRIIVRVAALPDPAGETLHISVEDTGPGMTPEQASLLFQPFSQADTSVTRKHGGTGLGLSISRRLAQLMSGDVTLVYTTPGIGSRFAVRLPLEKADGAEMLEEVQSCTAHTDPMQNEQQGQRLHGGRILVAEDGEDNQRLIAYHLRRAGAEVIIAEHGVRALELIDCALSNGNAFDLLVTDMQMPEMDGYTLARTLRARGSRMPIIALTAHAMADDRRRCIEAGCDDYASKPIDKMALVAACTRWLRTSTAHPVELFPVAAATEPTSPALRSEFEDDPDFRELIDRFVAGLSDRARRMEQCLHDADFETLGRLAHQMKGAAGGYGFPTIGDAAQQVEQFTRPADPPRLFASVHALLGECRSAVGSPTTLSRSPELP